MDTNNYYPFGLNHISGAFSTSNFGGFYSYKYNGKELQESGMYDYGARMYMADIGRWGVIDPLAETSRGWSTYAYAYNNPVMFIDPDGMQNVSALHWKFDRNSTILGNSWFDDSYVSSGFGNNFKTMWNGGDHGGGSGYYFSGSDAVKMLNYFKDGGTMDGLSFDGNEATWWKGTPTLTSYSGTDIHGEIDLGTGYHAKFSELPMEAYKNWADWGATTVGGGFKYVADQRTSLYNSGYWIDNLGQMRSTAYAGRARGSLIGLRSDYVRTTTMLGKYAKRAGYVGYAISAGQIGYGVYKDDWKFGVRAQVATANVAGGMAGAAAGAWALGKFGGAIGTLVGPEGTIIGAAVGGIVGSIVGGVWGGDIAEGWASKALNKADY
nr:RHS repeat-associated core domain-containing protein [Chryseobacterium indologenes]